MLPIPVQNFKESIPESVPEEKNTGFNDRPRSGCPPLAGVKQEK